MASDLEKQAKEALIDDHFELAVDLYTQAIAIDPNNSELYSDRAQANIKANNLTEAVADANKAIELDASLYKAYLRKGIACLKLEEYQTAKAALELGASYAPEEPRFANLIKECDELIAAENNELPKQPMETTTTESVTAAKDVEPVNPPSDQVTVAPVKPKYRHEFYQKPEEVVVTIFAKGIPAKDVAVEFGEQILSVSIDVPGEDTYHFQPRLFGKIIPEKCRFDVLSTKVEIRLAKAESIQWTSLEFSKDNPVPLKVNAPVIGAQRPSYPSSKPKRVDWDKLEAEVKKEEKDEKLDGDAALNKFFQDIYKDADEDTRRAMRKSFVESNGTVLSTNWKEVGNKKVEGSAPDGMEMKKWEY
ncbi:putative SGS domain, HSP20-like chaperone, tetratricopeptide-like helical domain-containing protein [Rosa chinensis]|uniref:Putative SGS domain, HSP20-like chaperone, tetratricopeptide-like helical domain-containing protein n=1 Tax=Rosa chinensis TaxID=74649 RepID=A0A2P6SNF9_ROSCH|nr:protein SGT1 homolog [Rosa chinensis]PRQ60226.1 putative SGS domain, HSP20-like chaperone, tetratricopeptide-like helical domain-containing protein [Rosa chinensis]